MIFLQLQVHPLYVIPCFWWRKSSVRESTVRDPLQNISRLILAFYYYYFLFWLRTCVFFFLDLWISSSLLCFFSWTWWASWKLIPRDLKLNWPPVIGRCVMDFSFSICSWIKYDSSLINYVVEIEDFDLPFCYFWIFCMSTTAVVLDSCRLYCNS